MKLVQYSFSMKFRWGFGRSGDFFAFQKLGVTPDILCLAKAMGAGMPIGAFISSSEKMNTLTNNRYWDI